MENINENLNKLDYQKEILKEAINNDKACQFFKIKSFETKCLEYCNTFNEICMRNCIKKYNETYKFMEKLI